MAFDGQDILDEIVYLGNDPDGDEFPAAQAPRIFNEALDVILAARPDLLLELDGTLDTPVAITDLVTAIDLPDRFKILFVEWFLYRGYGSDSRDIQDFKQSRAHKKNFDELLRSI